MPRDQLSLMIFNLIYAIFIVCIYHFKKKVITRELKVFGYLLDVNLISSIIELFCGFTIIWFGINSIISIIVNKIYIVVLMEVNLLIMLYILTISYNQDKENKYLKRADYISVILSIVYLIAVIILPIELFDGETMHSGGPCVIPLLIFGIITNFMSYFFMYHGLKKNKVSFVKYIPVLILSLGDFILFGFSGKYPIALTYFTLLETFIFIIMYFTIENPNVSIIRELNIAKREAEKANNAKSDFLASMSHAVRTPLNQIMGFTEAIKLRKEAISDEVYEEAEYIMEASNKLLEIVSNILDVNKIESSGIVLKEEKYNLKEKINEITNLYSTRINDKSLSLYVEQSEDIPEYLYGDIKHIKEIINNILSNAIKFTDEGRILVTSSCEIKDDICDIKIEITDTGKGMTEKELKNLFTKFNRAEDIKDSTISGAGLGLVIVKNLVDELKGEINVTSEENKGTTVTIIIPQKII